MKRSLAETYRPRSFGEVAGQAAVLDQLDNIRQRCGTLAGRAYFLRGASGTGKSLIARLICEEIADEFCTETLVGRNLNPVRARELHSSLRFRGFGIGGRGIVVEECHGLSSATIEELLFAIDPMNLPEHAVWCFTTTNDGQAKLFEDKIDAGPLLSRCIDLHLSKDLVGPFARRAREIAQAEGLDGQPLAAYETLIKDCKLNLRAALHRIEAGGWHSEPDKPFLLVGRR